MPKFMNNRYTETKLDLQLFAGEEDTGEDAGEGDDQDEDSEEDTDEDDEPRFTQADLDRVVAKTIAKERRRAERAAKKGQEKPEGSKKGEEESEDKRARQEAEAKTSKLEVKVACFEAGVAKDSIEDVAALAHAYMEADEDLDLEEAIEKVVKKYPQFTKGNADADEEEPKGKSWGQRQTGRTKKMSGVEARFYELNPDLKK